jgi:hypothetical protein
MLNGVVAVSERILHLGLNGIEQRTFPALNRVE